MRTRTRAFNTYPQSMWQCSRSAIADLLTLITCGYFLVYSCCVPVVTSLHYCLYLGAKEYYPYCIYPYLLLLSYILFGLVFWVYWDLVLRIKNWLFNLNLK